MSLLPDQGLAEDLEKHYSRIAPAYNAVILNQPENLHIKPLLDAIVHLLKEMGPAPIIDIGAGTCVWSSTIGQLLEETIECVEPVTALTQQALDLPQVRINNIDAATWPFAAPKTPKRLLFNQ